MMKTRIYTLLLCGLVGFTMMAQLTFDGKRLVYDKLTNTYLLTLPDSVFGRPYSAVTQPSAILRM